MKIDLNRFKEQMSKDIMKKFKWAVLSVFIFGIIFLAALLEDRQMSHELTKPFFKTDKLTETQIKKYFRYACIRNTIEYTIKSDTDYPDGWTEEELESFYESMRINCPLLADEWYEENK